MFKRLVGHPGRKPLSHKILCRSLLLLLLATNCANSLDALPSSYQPSLIQPARPLVQQSTEPLNSQLVTTLNLSTPIERELAGGQKHDYQVTLIKGQYANATVEQHGIDVVVRLIGVDGKPIADIDSQSRNQGVEKIEFVAETAGNYRAVGES